MKKYFSIMAFFIITLTIVISCIDILITNTSHKVEEVKVENVKVYMNRHTGEVVKILQDGLYVYISQFIQTARK